MSKKQKKRIKALEERVDALENEFFNLHDKLAELGARTLPTSPAKPLESPWTCSEEDGEKIFVSNEVYNELKEGMSPWQQVHMDNMAAQPVQVGMGTDTVTFEEYQKMFCEELDRQNEAYFHAGGENWPMGAPKTNSEEEE